MDFSGYDLERIRDERKTSWRLRHVCQNCGLISKKVLIAAHPTKDGRVCEECRKKLWYD